MLLAGEMGEQRPRLWGPRWRMSWGKSSGAASAGDLGAIHRQEQTGSRCYPQTHPRLFTPACTYNCVGFRGQESAFTFQKEANFEILGTVNGPTPPTNLKY